MSSIANSSAVYKHVDTQRRTLNFISRRNLEAASAFQNVKGQEKLFHAEDQETMELHSLARAQENEIRHLREQIALASIRESQLLNEKYALERNFSNLRMALDEKQSEVIASASNELAQRKGDLEVNFNLLSELKVIEDEKRTFTSCLLGILAECSALPHATNASALTNSIKHLHDRLQLKIRTSHAKLTEMSSIIENNSGLGFVENGVTNSSHNGHELSRYSHNVDGENFALADEASAHIAKMQQPQNTESPLRIFPNIERYVVGGNVNSMLTRNAFMMESEKTIADHISHPPILHDGVGSFSSKEDDPGIDDFQITGDAKPGCELLGCGFPTHGTSLCMFQWVRHYPDGTRQDIEGATNPDYLVTADDVDKLIAVECIPIDKQGRQGNLVRAFANDHNKITCDEEMQDVIDRYVSNGQATFKVLILLDSSENWEPATLFLRRSSFQVKVQESQDVVIEERYSKDLLIKIPSGFSAQFVLTSPNDSSYPFSTNNDIRMRDTLVLTMRIFQSKALDEKRKGRA